MRKNAVIAAAVLLAAGCGKGPDRSRDGYLQAPAGPSLVVARVGDREISRLELARAVNASAQPLLQRGGVIPENFSETILEMMIRTELIYQYGKDAVASPAQARREELYAEQRDRFSSDAILAEALALDGLTMEEFRDNLLKQAVVEVFLEREVHSRIEFSPEEIEEYYRKNQNLFRGSGGEVLELEQVRDRVISGLAAGRTPLMVEELVEKAREKFPVEKFPVRAP